MKHALRTSTLALVVLIVLTTTCKREDSAPSITATTETSTTAPPSQSNLPPNSWVVPVDVTNPPPTTPQPQSSYLNFGWQTFVALNWPALKGGQSGQPDPIRTVGAQAPNKAFIPTVWNTFRDLSTVMLPTGADPGATYTQAVTIPSDCKPIDSALIAPGFSPMLIDGTRWAAPTTRDYINQATLSPLVDQEGWYTITDIRINQSEYTYIQQNTYYLGQKQVTAVTSPAGLAPFPRTGQDPMFKSPLPTYAQYGALEIKAVWRILDPAKDAAKIPRYYTQWGYFIQPDGTTCQGPNLFGLIGLHILRLTPSTPSTWFWASFQHVDNVFGPDPTLSPPNPPTGTACATSTNYNQGPAQVTGNIPWNNTNTPNDICQVTPIPSNVQQVNQTWQQKLSGTVWQYYEMVNTLNPCPSDQSTCYTFPPISDTANLINVETFGNNAIETYYQDSNCETCHGFAAPIGAPLPLTGTNQIFSFVLQNAYYPTTSPEFATAREQLSRVAKTLPRGKPVAAAGGRAQ